jgi:TonB family protein
MNLGYRSFIFSFVFIQNAILAQYNWSIEDLKVTTFRNGDALLEVNSPQDLKFCSDNQQPAYFKNVNSKDTFYLYNYYAVIDPRGLAPIGYKIPSLEDLKTLNDSVFYQEPSNSWKTRGKGIEFYAQSNGYISHDNLEVLSDSVAGYYWTNSTANTLKSFVYIFLDNEPGFVLSELPRESFCSVRCVSNEKELKEFQSVENTKRQQKKYSDFKKIVSLEERILYLKNLNRILKDEKKQILDNAKSMNLEQKTNNSELLIVEIELARILNQTSNDTKSIDSLTEILPYFPGGYESMNSFLRENFNYPEEDFVKGVTGKVVVHFTVEPDGSLTNIYISKGLSQTSNAEALRLFKAMPRFVPGTYKGVKTKFEMRSAINFALE